MKMVSKIMAFGLLMGLAGAVQADLIAYESFDYAPSTVLKDGTANGGIGWDGGWGSAQSGLLLDTINQSLWFGNTPPFNDDGSCHIRGTGPRHSYRNWTTPISGTWYFTALVRVWSGTETPPRARFEFYSGQNATGHMRMNVGFNDYDGDGNADLFIAASTGVYPSSPEEGQVYYGDFTEETYLLVAKRTANGVFASLIRGDADADSLASEPTWLVSETGLTGVSFQSLKIAVSDSMVRIDEIRIATDWASAVEGLVVTPEPDRTFVFSVDQPFTTDSMSWSHPVAEAGSYQIGMAWIEAVSGNDVAVEIFHNQTRVKAFYAPVGEVTRFETRLEGLAAGDEIRVKTTADESSYRIGYEIAFGTPTFDGLPIFDVADYGAAGDGTTDDFAAIQSAVSAAINAGGGTVRFDGAKIYRTIGLDDLTVETLIDLEGANDIKIEGNGATVVLHPPDRFANITYAENVQIDGFTINYDPKVYYQGIITDINVADMTIDLTVPDRYPIPMTGVVESPGYSGDGRGPFFGRSFIPDWPGARSGHGDNIYIESILTNGGPRQIQIQVPDIVHGDQTGPDGEDMRPRVQYAYDNNATEFVVPHYLYGHRNGTTRIYFSSRIKLSNLHYTSMAHMWLTIQHNHGPVTLSNVNLQTPNPETELFVSWRDGMHIRNGRWGILIEDSDWDGAAMYDDTFAIYSRAQKVVDTSDNVVTLTPIFGGREIFLWQPGDWASFWCPDQKTLRGMARVLGATNVAAPNFEVTLESIPDDVTADDIVIHEESVNRNTVIRNCRSTTVGTGIASTRLRSVDLLFQDCHLEEFKFWVHQWNSSRPRNVVFENIYVSSFQTQQFNLHEMLGASLIGCTLDNAYVNCRESKDVYIDGVNWTNMTGNILELRNSSSAWLFGDSSRNGDTENLPDYVLKDDTSSISYSVPSDYPPPEPPAVPFDCHLLTLFPEADSYVQGGYNANTNFGSETVLECKTDTSNELYTRYPYLRFDLSSLSGFVKHAALRMKVASADGIDDIHTVWFVSDDSWDELDITWNNRPAVSTMLDSSVHPSVGSWNEFDVTSQVRAELAGNQLMSMAISSNGTVLVGYYSKEAEAEDRPKLVVALCPFYEGDLTFNGKVDMEDVEELSRQWQDAYDMKHLLDVAADWLLDWDDLE